MQLSYKNKKIVVHIFWIFFISFSVFCNINQVLMPYCVSDEIGYWTAAAWLHNVDWSPLMSHSQYYNWGYGLVLALIFNIADGIFRLRIAVIINIVIMVLSFEVLVLICNKIFRNNSIVNIFISGTASVYSYLIVFAHTTMSEVFLSFLFIVNIYLFIIFIERPTLIKGSIFLIAMILLQATHLRSIICIVALFLTLIYMMIEKKIKIRWVIFLLLGSVSALSITYLVKDYLVQDQYTSTKVVERLTANEGIGSHLSILEQANTLVFWKNFIFSSISKFFYLICATSLTIYGYTAYVLKYIIENIRSKKRDIKYYSLVYLTLCFGGAYAVAVIETINPYRIDAMFYARYLEYTIPILICVGMKWIIKNCHNNKLMIYSSLFVLYISKIIFGHLKSLGITTAINLNISWFSAFIKHENINSYEHYTFYPAILSLYIILIILFLCRIKKEKLACVILAICWTIGGQVGWLNIVQPMEERMNNVLEVVRRVDEVDGDIYCFIPDNLSASIDEFVDISWIQYHLGKRTIYEIDENDIENKLEKKYILIWNKNEKLNSLKKIGEVRWENERFTIIYL